MRGWSKGLTKETGPRIAKLSESHKGEKCYNFGKHLSDECKRKIGDANRGKNNGMWKGDNASAGSGRERARRLMGAPEGFDVHHIDGNPVNNDISNLKIVTRTEHMDVDGRMEKLIIWNSLPETRIERSESLKKYYIKKASLQK